MGYADIKARKRHEADAARIRELERLLRQEREDRRVAANNACVETEGESKEVQNAVIETIGIVGIIAIFAILITLTAAYFGR